MLVADNSFDANIVEKVQRTPPTSFSAGKASDLTIIGEQPFFNPQGIASKQLLTQLGYYDAIAEMKRQMRALAEQEIRTLQGPFHTISKSSMEKLVHEHLVDQNRQGDL